jgi:hypothetical protein
MLKKMYPEEDLPKKKKSHKMKYFGNFYTLFFIVPFRKIIIG